MLPVTPAKNSLYFKLAALLLSAMFLHVASALAETSDSDDAPSITNFRASLFSPRDNAIQELSRRGLHYEALTKLEDKPDSQRTLSEKIAGGNSAWALGLPDVARKYWKDVLANEELDAKDRYRVMLSSAILELQENNFDKSRAFAERALRNLGASNMSAQFWLIIAESLKNEGALSRAQKYYERAAAEGEAEVKDEAHYLLGECQNRLGLLEQARYSFAAIDTESKFAPAALLRMIEIDIAQRNYEGVLTWVGESRDRFAQQFDNPWIYHSQIVALIELQRFAEAQQELRQFELKYSVNDRWYSLAKSALESALVLQQLPSLNTAKKEIGSK